MIRFNGMEVIVHRTQTVVRTWKERLFSRPWRPLAHQGGAAITNIRL